MVQIYDKSHIKKNVFAVFEPDGGLKFHRFLMGKI